MNPMWLIGTISQLHLHFVRTWRLSLPMGWQESLSPELVLLVRSAATNSILGLIRAVALRHPEWQFVFIGPQSEGEPSTDLSEVVRPHQCALAWPQALQPTSAVFGCISVRLVAIAVQRLHAGDVPDEIF